MASCLWGSPLFDIDLLEKFRPSPCPIRALPAGVVNRSHLRYQATAPGRGAIFPLRPTAARSSTRKHRFRAVLRNPAKHRFRLGSGWRCPYRVPVRVWPEGSSARPGAGAKASSEQCRPTGSHSRVQGAISKRRRQRQRPLRPRSQPTSAMVGARWQCSGSNPSEDQGTVGPAEAEGVRQRDFDVHLPGAIGYVVQVALRVLIAQIDGGRCNLVMHG